MMIDVRGPRLRMMMRRVAAMFALVCSVLFLGPSAQAMRAESESSLTIRLVSTLTRNGLTVDRAPRHAASKGDVVWFRSVLRNQVAQFGRPAAAIVGREYAVFTFLTDRTARVNVTVWLPGGTLRLRREEDITRPVHSGTVVSGTGAFTGAGGTCVSRDAQGGHSLSVYRLRIP
jgi:hypothetical protein